MIINKYIIITFLLLNYFWESTCINRNKRDINRKENNIVRNDEEEDDKDKDDKKEEKYNFLIPKGYNKLEIPIVKQEELVGTFQEKHNASKIQTKVGVIIRNVKEVDELNEEITVEMDFIANWVDKVIYVSTIKAKNLRGVNYSKKQLADSFKTIDPSFLKKIWKPDLFIENVVTTTRPDLLSQPIKLMFSDLGVIIYSTRISIKMVCSMEFHYYPADTQVCNFNLRSYAHPNTELELKWRNNYGIYILDRSEHNFDIKVTNVDRINYSEPSGAFIDDFTQEYQVLKFSIAARRKMNYHLIQTYLPSMFFIFITWLCFLIPPSMVEARIGVAMTTLLTLTSMFASVRESTPSVSYVKAIDIWMVSCIFFVFSTLLEFTVLIYLRHDSGSDKKNEEKGSNLSNENITLMSPNVGDERVREPMSIYEKEERTSGLFARIRQKRERRRANGISNLKSLSQEKKEWLGEFIERFAFLGFFLVFLFFNCIYWPWLLISADYFDWTVDPEYNANAS